MDKIPDIPQETKGKFSRRTLLKVGVAAVAAPLLKTPIPQKLETFYNQNKTSSEKVDVEKDTWEIENAILSPGQFFDYIVKEIKSLPEDRITDVDTQFLKIFDPESKDQNFDIRTIVEKAYEQNGQEILRQRQQIIDLDLFPGINIDLYLPSFSNLTRPWAILVEKVRLHQKEGKPIHLNYDEIGGFAVLAEWFRDSIIGTYDEQKAKYVAKGKKSVNLKAVEENIDTEWDFFTKAQRWGKFKDWDPRRKEGQEIQKGILEVIDKNLPLAYADFKYDTLNVGSRAFFEEIDFTDKKLSMDQYESSSALHAWLIDKEKIPLHHRDWDSPPQYYFVRYLKTKLHELFHGVDPFFKDTSWRFLLFHPRDYLEYTGEYLEMYKDFNTLIKGNPKTKTPSMRLAEMEQWFFDPMRLERGFGIDELKTPQQIAKVKEELDWIHMVCAHLEHPLDGKKYQKWAKEIGIDKPFNKGNKNFLNWTERLKNISPFNRKIIKETVSNFNQISMKHIQELQTLIDRLYVKGEEPSSEMEALIIKVKSLYILSCFIFLKGLAEKKVLKPQDPLYIPYQKFAEMVGWQLGHGATGLDGEYNRLAGIESDMRIHPEKELEFVKNVAKAQRKSIKLPLRYNKALPDFLELYADHIVNLTGKRAKMLGADTINADFARDPNLVYQTIAGQVIEKVLELPDWYGESIG